jgi:predicted nucleic acid-binding protein
VRYVLDANIAIAALNNFEAVRGRLQQVPASEVGIPMVALAELVYGATRAMLGAS